MMALKSTQKSQYIFKKCVNFDALFDTLFWHVFWSCFLERFFKIYCKIYWRIISVFGFNIFVNIFHFFWLIICIIFGVTFGGHFWGHFLAQKDDPKWPVPRHPKTLQKAELLEISKKSPRNWLWTSLNQTLPLSTRKGLISQHQTLRVSSLKP